MTKNRRTSAIELSAVHRSVRNHVGSSKAAESDDATHRKHQTPALPPHVLLQNLIFRFLQNKQRIQIWLYENADLRIEGRIIVSTPPTPRPL